MVKRRKKTLKFNTAIYKRKAIEVSMSAFKEVADFLLVNNKRYVNVRLQVKEDYDIDVVADEFANYALGETKKCV